jgi:glycosyltransferase involved in cell wall biosynthesis
MSLNILALNWNDLKNPFAGGAEVQLEEMIVRLVARGHSVTLFCSNFAGGAPEETVSGIRIVRRGNRYNFNLLAPFHLRRLVRDGKFDVMLEDINKIPFYTPWFLTIPTLILVPHLFAETVFQEINPVLGTYIYLSEKPMIRSYRGFRYCAASESTQSDLAMRGVPLKDITVVHCGVDRETYSYDASVEKYDTPTILYLGRVKKYKSIQHLIDAMTIVRKTIPNARVMVVGAGDYLPTLESQAKRLGLADCIEFAGFVPTANKVERLRKSHVIVLPSIREGWGLTNIEANAVGTCVVASDAPGLRDSVRDGETGFLFPYGDIPSLAEKLVRILTDFTLRKRLETGGLAWANKFSWDTATERLESLLYEVAGKRP